MSRSGCFRQIVERLSVSLTGGLSKDKRGVISHTTLENGSRAFTSSVSNTGLLDLRHALFKNATRRGQTRLASSSSSGKPAANKGASASGPDAAAAERINVRYMFITLSSYPVLLDGVSLKRDVCEVTVDNCMCSMFPTEVWE